MSGLELTETGITCNAVALGWVLGTHNERVMNVHMEKTGQNFSEAGTSGGPRRLLMPDAASEITGATMPIDCAWSAKL